MKLNYLLPLILLVLLACPAPLQATESDEEGYIEHSVLKAFMWALESLDVRGHQLPRTELLEELKVYSQSSGGWFASKPTPSSVLLNPMPTIDEAISELTKSLKLSTEFCFSKSRMGRFNYYLGSTRMESLVGYKLLKGVLSNQRRLCEDGVQKELKDYKSTKPNDWGLIQDLQRCYKNTPDPNEETFGTRMMAKLLEMRLPESEQQCEKLVEEAEKVADDTMEACLGFEEKFRSHVSSVEMIKAMFGYRPYFGPDNVMNLIPCWNACRDAFKADNEAAVMRAVDTRCNVFQEPVDKFRANNPQDWQLISELNGNFRKRNFSPSGVRFKQAKQELLQKRLQEGGKLKSRDNLMRRAKAVDQAVKSACKNFETELEPILERACELPAADQLLDYKEVCLGWSIDLPKIIEETVNYLLLP